VVASLRGCVVAVVVLCGDTRNGSPELKNTWRPLNIYMYETGTVTATPPRRKFLILAEESRSNNKL